LIGVLPTIEPTDPLDGSGAEVCNGTTGAHCADLNQPMRDGEEAEKEPSFRDSSRRFPVGVDLLIAPTHVLENLKAQGDL